MIIIFFGSYFMSQAFQSKNLLTEFIGTAILVATVVGSGIMATNLTQDVGLQLFCNTIPTGAILFVLISILGPVSGAHFNPVVTAVFALNKSLPSHTVVGYITAQIAGGIAGTMLAHGMFDMNIIEFSIKVRTGNAIWISEIVATFGLVLAIIIGSKHALSNIPAVVTFYITAAYWFTASTSFANPAVTIARSLTNSFSGIAPSSVSGFILAQCIGGYIALLVAEWLMAE